MYGIISLQGKESEVLSMAQRTDMTVEDMVNYEWIVESGICKASILNAIAVAMKNSTWAKVFDAVIFYYKGFKTFDEYFMYVMENE